MFVIGVNVIFCQVVVKKHKCTNPNVQMYTFVQIQAINMQICLLKVAWEALCMASSPFCHFNGNVKQYSYCTSFNLRIIPTNMTTSYMQPHIQCQASVLHSFTVHTPIHTMFCLCSFSQIFAPTPPISHVHTCTLRHAFAYKYSF